MNEVQAPLIRISGTVSDQQYAASIRDRNMRQFWLYAIIILAVIVLSELISCISYVIEDIADGYLTVFEAIPMIGWYLFDDISLSTVFLVLGILIVYGAILFLFHPMRGAKQVRELYPDGMPLVYEFYEDHLTVESNAPSRSSSMQLNYTDVQRKIRETNYLIILSTGQRNRLGLFKTIMTAEQLMSVRSLLYSRCPQRKLRN